MIGISKRQFLVVSVLMISCTEKKDVREKNHSIELNEIITTRLHDYKGEKYDSKIALSKNRLVIQTNVLYHSVYKIADSSIESVVNGFYKKDTSNFRKEVNDYKLKEYCIKQFISPKEKNKDTTEYDKDGYASTKILANNGILFYLNSRPVNGKINLELSKGDWKDTLFSSLAGVPAAVPSKGVITFDMSVVRGFFCSLLVLPCISRCRVLSGCSSVRGLCCT